MRPSSQRNLKAHAQDQVINLYCAEISMHVLITVRAFSIYIRTAVTRMSEGAAG